DAAVLRRAPRVARAGLRRTRARRGRAGPVDARARSRIRRTAAALLVAAVGRVPAGRRVGVLAGAAEERAARAHLCLHVAGGAEDDARAAGAARVGRDAADPAHRLGVAPRPDALGAGDGGGERDRLRDGAADRTPASGLVRLAWRRGGPRHAVQVQLRAVLRGAGGRGAGDARGQAGGAQSVAG